MRLTFLILHVLSCLLLIFIVLVQHGRGAGMGVTFGGSSETLFGSAGPTSFLHKLTTVVAIVFMITSLSLSLFKAVERPKSVMEGAPKQVETTSETAPKQE